MNKLARIPSRLAFAAALFTLLAVAPSAAAGPSVVWTNPLSQLSWIEDMEVDLSGRAWVVGSIDRADPDWATYPAVALVAPEGDLRYFEVLETGLNGQGLAVDLPPTGILHLAGFRQEEVFSDTISGFLAYLNPDSGFVNQMRPMGSGSTTSAEDVAVVDDGTGWGTAWVITSSYRQSFWNLWRVPDPFSGSPQEYFSPHELKSVAAGPAGVFVTGNEEVRTLEDGFVERRDLAGNILYHTLLTAPGQIFVPEAVAATPAGEAWVTGSTYFVDRPEQGFDVFVARLDASGTVLAVRTLDGTGDESGQAVAVAPSGDVVVGGGSGASCGPLHGADECERGFVARFSPDLTLLWAIDIGSSRAEAVGVGANEDVWVATRFDGVSRIADTPLNTAPDCSAATASPAGLWPPNGKLVPVQIGGVTDPDGDPVEISVTWPAATAVSFSRPLNRRMRGNDLRRTAHTSLRLATLASCAVFVAALHGEASSLQTAAQPPPSMAFSTFFGGERWDWGQAVAVDADGNTYMTGFVEGDLGTSQAEAFVVKVDSAGTPVWSILLGGDGWDEGASIAAAADGDVWVFGSTSSSDFPLTDPWETLPVDQRRLFLARLSAAGALEFSTVFEGSRGVGVEGMALDAAGNVYIGGGSSTADGSRGYVLKIDPVVPQIVWSAEVASPSCLYGSAPSGFTVDPAGRAYLTWHCQTARLLPSGSLDYVVSSGGTDIAADAAGNAYLLSSVVRPPHEWASDVLVTRLGPTGQPAGTLQLGGSWEDWGEAISVDPEGHVYVAGETQSGDFPLKDAVQPDCSNTEEPYQCWSIGFLAKIRPDTWDLVYSTFLGGGRSVVSNRDRTVAWGVAAGHGATAVTGWTVEEDFTVVNAFQPFLGGDEDGFLVRIVDHQPPDCSAATASPAVLWPPNGKMVPLQIGGVTDPNGDLVEISVTSIRQDEPLTKKGQPDATGIGTSSPWLRADRAGQGDGRVYHLTFEATDPAGAACTGTVTICVPHDQGKRTCGDGGPLFPSIR